MTQTKKYTGPFTENEIKENKTYPYIQIIIPEDIPDIYKPDY